MSVTKQEALAFMITITKSLASKCCPRRFSINPNPIRLRASRLIWICKSITTFTNIVAECDGKPCTEQIEWSAKVKDANCGMQAHIDNATQIRITWDTNGVSEYDNMTRAELFEMNQKSGVGWSKKLKRSK